MSDTAIDLESRISNRMKAIPPSGIRRFFEIAATMKDVISLGIGEPDFVSPKAVIEAVIDSFEKGKTGYTANAGMFELRESIVQDIESRYGVRYDATTEVMVTVGASEAMLLASLVLLNPGDEILIPEPSFVSYGPLATISGGRVVNVPTYVGNNFEVSVEDIESRITSHSKVLFLGYPNNPTGAVLKRQTLLEIADLVVKHDLMLISDEIYDRLIYGEAFERGHVCVPSVEALRKRTVLVGGLSKNYAMTGWRIGFACAPEPIYQAMYRAHQYIVMSAPTMGQIGAVAAIKDCQREVEEMRLSYDERRRIIVDGLRAAGLPTFEPEGAFYCFPDIRSTRMTSEEFAEKLLEEEHVACVPGSAFGPSGEGYIRCSYATAKDKLVEAVKRIGGFVTRHSERNG